MSLSVLVNTTIYHRYVGGDVTEEQVRYAYTVSAGTQERIKRQTVSKLLSTVGKDHDIAGEIIYTDAAGNHVIPFSFKPHNEKMLIPEGYQTEPVKTHDTGKRILSGLNNAFDTLMGGKPAKKK